MEKNNSYIRTFIRTLQSSYEIKDKSNRRLIINYEDDFGEKIIELDGKINIENIQILITALTELKNDFGGN